MKADFMADHVYPAGLDGTSAVWYPNVGRLSREKDAGHERKSMAEVGSRDRDVRADQERGRRLQRGRTLRRVLGLVVLVALLLGMATACGEDDLTFPGSIPIPTAAPEPTDTPTP